MEKIPDATKTPKKMGRPKSKNPKTCELNVRFDAEIWETLVDYASRHSISKAEAIRRGILKLVEAETGE